MRAFFLRETSFLLDTHLMMMSHLMSSSGLDWLLLLLWRRLPLPVPLARHPPRLLLLLCYSLLSPQVQDFLGLWSKMSNQSVPNAIQAIQRPLRVCVRACRQGAAERGACKGCSTGTWGG